MLGLTLNDDDEPQEVLIWVKNRDYPYLETNPIHESQKVVREENDGKVISLHICVNYELVMRIFSYNIGVKVLAPSEESSSGYDGESENPVRILLCFRPRRGIEIVLYRIKLKTTTIFLHKFG